MQIQLVSTGFVMHNEKNEPSIRQSSSYLSAVERDTGLPKHLKIGSVKFPILPEIAVLLRG